MIGNRRSYGINFAFIYYIIDEWQSSCFEYYIILVRPLIFIIKNYYSHFKIKYFVTIFYFYNFNINFLLFSNDNFSFLHIDL